jgi:hypothetical protein
MDKKPWKEGKLFEHLQKALDAKLAVTKLGGKKVSKKKKMKGDNLTGFAGGSYCWVPLVTIPAPIKEPENPTFLKATDTFLGSFETGIEKVLFDISIN